MPSVAAHGLDRLARACAKELAEGAPSDYFARSEVERLSPLLYYCFDRLGWPDTVPEDERRHFRKAYYASAGRNVDLLDALGTAAEALSARKIQTIAVKGADLATNVYPSVALRPMSDIDLCVAPEQGDAAEATLTELGYRPYAPEMKPGLSRKTRHAKLFIGGARDNIAIDLHWSLVGGPGDKRAPHYDWLRDNTVRSDAPYARLSETAHLAYLAAHMKLQHYDEEIPLLWLVDFTLLASSSTMDWELLFADARALGWSDALAATARDVHRRLAVDLPEPLAQFTDSRPLLPQTAQLHRRDGRDEPERVFNELTTLPWHARWALVCALVLPSVSYMRFRYPSVPSWAWPLAYPLRWARFVTRAAALVKRGIGRVVRRETRTQPLLASPDGRKSC
ncbi:MAG: hypothetical protein E2P02_06825 [Acidobacteria bacterium]|nr:MAG: hypothetical protein E2P02_06825 [Acidobacteriota bacterium]